MSTSIASLVGGVSLALLPPSEDRENLAFLTATELATRVFGVLKAGEDPGWSAGSDDRSGTRLLVELAPVEEVAGFEKKDIKLFCLRFSFD
jgi:hypothetical protein